MGGAEGDHPLLDPGVDLLSAVVVDVEAPLISLASRAQQVAGMDVAKQGTPSLQGSAVAVIGLGASGLAAARFLSGRGAKVTASDARAIGELGPGVAELERLGVRLETGGHREATFAGADLVIVSPGVPLTIAPLAAARAAGVPIWSEVELAARFLRGSLIGITGSNGKSTVTAWTAHLLQGAEIDAVACGNLGLPLVALVGDDRPERRYVVELSSFQLEGIERLRPRVSVMTNLSPDHQDRYPTVAEYGAAKARIFMNQGAGDDAILNADDPWVAQLPTHGAARHTFSVLTAVADGAFLEAGMLRLRLAGRSWDLLAAEELPTEGRHNIENALAASLAACLAGARPERLREGLRTFRGLPHRMERVATLDGIAWYNDSKATNVGATRRVLESLDRPLVLILGGKDKGADFGELRPLLAGRVRHLVLVGHARQVIAAALAGTVPMTSVETMDDAVQAARAAARPGDAVLLAPACASFDAYRNFEERGEHFRALVARLVAAAGGSGE
jgi:UDP-N-acetylmuramoylalanine--D-glutamate ligase